MSQPCPCCGLARCEKCGSPYEPSRRDAVYCSNACRQAAYRARTADAEPLSYLERLRKIRNGEDLPALATIPPPTETVWDS
jgi:hypothetical protein